MAMSWLYWFDWLCWLIMENELSLARSEFFGYLDIFPFSRYPLYVIVQLTSRIKTSNNSEQLERDLRVYH